MKPPFLPAFLFVFLCSVASAQPNCVVDTVPPVFDTIYAPVVFLECPETLPPVVFPGGTDDCDTSVIQSALTIIPAGDPCDGIRQNPITRTYFLQDQSGNLTQFEQVFIQIDTTPPQIMCPADIVYDCSGPSPIIPPNMATDECTPQDSIVLTAISSVALNQFGLPVETYTYTATDCRGNSSFCSFTVTAIDTTPPMFDTIYPAVVFLECPDFIPSVDFPGGTDNCDTSDLLQSALTIIPGPNSCDGLRDEPITRTYFLQDASGNLSQFSQQFIQIDTTPPEIFCPGPIEFECGGGGPIIPPVTAMDNCTSDDSITITAISTIALDPCGLTIETFTYTATDCRGNSSSCSFTLTEVDMTPPMLTLPDDITFQCVAGDFGVANATDDCDTDPTVTFTDLEELDGFGLGTITRTWTATDCSGNEVSEDQVIQIIDGQAPFITMPIDRKFFGCELGELEEPLIVDNCGDGNLTITEEFIENLDECGEGEIIRVVTVTDGEGNTTEGRQTLRITQYVRPTIECSPDVTISCEDIVPVPVATGTAGCGDVSISMETIDNRIRCTTGEVQFVFTATDCRGVSAVCTSTVTIVDPIPPTLTVPDDMTFECELGDYGFAEVNDNCEEVDLTGMIMGELDSCGFGTIEIMYMVRSFCDQPEVEPQSQFLTVDDTTPPLLSVPDDQTIACEEDLIWGEPESSDNCGVVELGFEDTRDTSSANEIRHERRWEAVDCKGNTTVVIQVITEVCAQPIDLPTDTSDIDTVVVVDSPQDTTFVDPVDTSMWIAPEISPKDYAQDVDFTMFPNPSTGIVNFKGEGIISIYNVSGQFIDQVNVDQKPWIRLNAGVYVCHQNDTVKKLIVLD